MAMPTKQELNSLSLDELIEAYPKMDLSELITLKQEELNDYVHEDNRKKNLVVSREEDQKRKVLRDNSTGSVITDIDLPWERVFWVSFQFLVVGLVLAIPAWIIVMSLFAITS